ncbi:MAG: hypothetical protein FWE53_01340 [Firmicutes bacterium]|nr:hypothetical protein [Bacillota bacterium]
MDKNEIKKLLKDIRNPDGVKTIVTKEVKNPLDKKWYEQKVETLTFLSDVKDSDLRLAFWEAKWKNKAMLFVNCPPKKSGYNYIHSYIVEPDGERFLLHHAGILSYETTGSSWNKQIDVIKTETNDEYVGGGLGGYRFVFLDEIAHRKDIVCIDAAVNITYDPPHGWVEKGVKIARADKLYEQNGYEFSWEEYDKFIDKRVTEETIAQIEDNSEMVGGVRVYAPFDKWPSYSAGNKGSRAETVPTK